MRSPLVRLFAVCVLFLLAAASAQSATPRCVTSGGLSYCCWPGHMCRVCDSVQCFLLPVSECPQSCP